MVLYMANRSGDLDKYSGEKIEIKLPPTASTSRLICSIL